MRAMRHNKMRDENRGSFEEVKRIQDRPIEMQRMRKKYDSSEK